MTDYGFLDLSPGDVYVPCVDYDYLKPIICLALSNELFLVIGCPTPWVTHRTNVSSCDFRKLT